MDQDRIGKFIRDIRKKAGLTQQMFAQKYGVTYQAVSKWENGRNIPDLTILKQICCDYNINLNDLLDGKEGYNIEKNNHYGKRIIGIVLTILMIIVLVSLCMYLLPKKNTDDFEFKTLSATCDNFNLYGSLAYNDKKTSIYISNITYCGDEINEEYKQIKCILYENDGDTKRQIDSYYYDDSLITLDKFLEMIDFNIEHYSDSCKMYKENALELEIEAVTSSNENKVYKIPLKVEDNCD